MSLLRKRNLIFLGLFVSASALVADCMVRIYDRATPSKSVVVPENDLQLVGNAAGFSRACRALTPKSANFMAVNLTPKVADKFNTVFVQNPNRCERIAQTADVLATTNFGQMAAQDKAYVINAVLLTATLSDTL